MTFDISPIAIDRMDLMARHIRRMPPLAREGESRVWAVFHPPSAFHADEDPENPDATYWEQDWFFEEHPFLALQVIHQGRCHIKTLLESYPAGYPQHRVLNHVADALEMLNESPPDCSRYELRTLKQQAEFTARRALAGAHTVSEENVQQFFEALLELELPGHIMISALSIGVGNDPILEPVLRNRIQFPPSGGPRANQTGHRRRCRRKVPTVAPGPPGHRTGVQHQGSQNAARTDDRGNQVERGRGSRPVRRTAGALGTGGPAGTGDQLPGK